LSVTGTAVQSGAVTIGDASTKAAKLTIAAAATYTIDGDVGMARGTSGGSRLTVSGKLIKSAGTGASVIAVKVTDTGTIEAASGTLDFTQAMSGTGSMSVDSGATLEADLTVAHSLSMTFNGGNGVLALKDPSKFAATINGFAPGETIDLLGKKATTATLGTGDTLVIKNGSSAVATLQLAGTYTGDTFNVASDGNGGTDVTVSTSAPIVPPAGHQFIAAMAAFDADGGAAHITTQARVESWRPLMAAPRTIAFA